MINKNYAGMDGFIWWMGVVESRKDPLLLGRCQVRIFGWHTADLVDIPSEDLPWAQCAHAVNSSMTFGTPKESDLVFGFFVDGRNAQIPVILGVIPNLQSQPPNAFVGFNDVRSQDEIRFSPKKPVSRSYRNTGEGVAIAEANTNDPQVLETLRYPNPNDVGKPAISGLSRGDLRSNDVTTGRRSRGNKFIQSADDYRFSIPGPGYSTDYPFNKVTETESGHSLEFDDTPGTERITLSHRSGTTLEILPTGTMVQEVVKNNYKLVFSDDHVHVLGKAIVTIDSDCLIKIKGNVELEAGNDFNLNVSGSANISVKEDLNIKAKNISLQSEDDFSSLSGADTLMTSGGTNNIKGSGKVLIGSSSTVDINASNINLNSPGTPSPKGAKSVSLDSPDSRATKNVTQPFVESGPTVFEVVAQDDETPKTLEEYNAILTSAGLPPVENVPVEEGAANVPDGGGEVKDVKCGSIVLLDDYSKVKVSANFTLADFTQGGVRKLRAHRGVSADQILCNIVKLAENICEPLFAAGIKFNITSAFRRPGDAPGSSETSDHNFGRAIDIQIPGASAYESANRVYAIVGNISKQFLLEYASGPGWIHIAYDDGKKHPLPLATFNNHAVYARNKLVDLKPGVRVG